MQFWAVFKMEFEKEYVVLLVRNAMFCECELWKAILKKNSKKKKLAAPFGKVKRTFQKF